MLLAKWESVQCGVWNSESTTDSPRGISCPIRRSRARRGMHIADAGILLVYGEEYLLLHYFPVRFIGHRILGNDFKVAALDEVVEGLRCFLFVKGVLRNQRAQREQVLTQHGLARL